MTSTVYLLATALIWFDARSPASIFKFTGILLSLLALTLHGYLLYQWIEVDAGQNLSASNLFSMILWLAGILVLIAMVRMPIRSLLILIFPLAVISILLVGVFPGEHIVITGLSTRSVIHILLGVLTFSVQALVVLQVLWLVMQDYLLKHGWVSQLLDVLPPLETMERLLFQLIGLGFILLSLVLLDSIIIYNGITAAMALSKTFLSITAWLVFAILLWGRYRLGWRGQLVIRWTMIGIVILMVVFVISNLL